MIVSYVRSSQLGFASRRDLNEARVGWLAASWTIEVVILLMCVTLSNISRFFPIP